MRTFRFQFILALTSLLCPGALAVSETSSPPVSMSPKVQTAVAELFDQGLADPRGGEYREIEIKTGIDLTVKTHGWVLPGKGPVQMAVAWNGLIYPVTKSGPPASLDQDVADMLARDEKAWGKAMGPKRDVRGRWPVSEWNTVSQEYILPLKVALLLRLGQDKLAGTIWNRWFELSSEGLDDPYLLMAREWVETLESRARYAHLRGDDTLALSSCRMVLPLRDRVEATAAQRGFPSEPDGKPYLAGMEDLPLLAADQERRAHEKPYLPVLESGQPAEGPERIAALIRDLELVAARQFSNPGQTDVSSDPIVQALIKEGDPAVEPLLKCVEEDTRLTRSEFTQGMQIKPGTLIPVYEPAFVSLIGILKEPFSLSSLTEKDPRRLSLEDRKALTATIRDYWEKHRGLSLPDRWYATLQDDHAAATDWFLAVDNIVQPTNTTRTLGTMFGNGGSSGGGTLENRVSALEGEALRTKSQPSVSELIVKRFRQLVGQPATQPDLSFVAMGKLILALAAWDGKAHLPEIREMALSFHTRFPHGDAPFASTLQTESAIYQQRVALGDPQALQDYADWLVALSPKEWHPWLWVEPFQVMWHFPEDPIMRQTAEKLFAEKDSPWVPLIGKNPRGGCDLLTTPMIGLTAFRKEALRGLRDQSPAGTVKIYEGGNVAYTLIGADQDGSCQAGGNDPLAPKPGTVIPFRVCDFYAYKLAYVDSFPAIQLYWPQALRDQAVKDCAEFLERYGNNFQAPSVDAYENTIFFTPQSGYTHFRLHPLDRPATPEDVKAGRALFSLSGTTRIWKMPRYPLGPAWQAEEVLVDGKWERYYGLFEKGKPVKVPAVQIDFPGSFPWQGKVTAQFSGELEGPPDFDRRELNMSYAKRLLLHLGEPVPVTVSICNHTGLDLSAPESVLIPSGATKTLPEGISLTVSYSDKVPPVIQRFEAAPFDFGAFLDIPLRKEVVVSREKGLSPMLTPTGKLPVLKIDLREFFDLSHPGTYKVKVLFHVPGQPASESSVVTFSIAGAQ